MAAGAPGAVVEPDRRAAIAYAVALARPGDAVVVAGKGHETGQEVAGVVTPFDDREVLRELLGPVAGVIAARRWRQVAAVTGARLDGAAPQARVDGGRRGRQPPGRRRAGCSSRCPASAPTATTTSPPRSPAGAVAALTARPLPGLPCLVVPDPLAALQALAAHVFAADQPRTFGITGSSGKTSTKDLLAQLLGDDVLAPVGSFNNELGLPLTLLRRTAATPAAVLEYSARGVGHIAFLTGLARPHVALELNVGSAHLGEFGSVEAIAQAKGELVEARPAVRRRAARRRPQRRRPAGAGDAHRAPGGHPGASSSAPARTPRCAPRTSCSTTRAGRRSGCCTPQGEAPVRLALVGEHHVAQRPVRRGRRPARSSTSTPSRPGWPPRGR